MEILNKFSKRFNKRDDVKKASESEIKNFESEFGIVLPNDFKKFIAEYGNIWTPDILDIIVDNEIELNDVQNFWDIETISFDKKNEWTSQISTDLIPFASDSMGNIFGFLSADLKTEKESSSVYFFDHDFNTVDKIADSFSEWINEFNKL
ncbi:SMI1/KNR4 family protein [Aquimarina rubra]|uniref:SMI1/KNR4 family protein n=1 Tax=Aquimarina rubra TaxID=1920033 RepID=A0ABW5LNN3_9FLAO